jgi:hypothetical protein
MQDDWMKSRDKKRRRAVLVSVGFLVVLAAGGLVLAFVERMRDVSDRAT